MENNITYQYESLYTLVFLGGFFAILGHCFPVTFLIVLLFSKEHYKRAIDYKGGKGVSATVGLIIMISP
jgi:glycerol-3-phosphate acyltransferase PlsY